LIKSRASGDAETNMSDGPFTRSKGTESIIVDAKGERAADMSSGDGFPVHSRTLSSWFIVELPGKHGLPRHISPRMQPTAHISTPFVYRVEPKRISGARYHLVAT
jgi:hypothetical protein